MALTPGTRLGVYEVTAQIGAGGMGEVYRATDSNLKRSVAIKVLPASVAGDADRLARFQREAEVLAALNHPNIGAIYGLEKTPEFTALVMELVEGEDLSQRIARGAIPLDEALPIAKQIAGALEAAHEQGIVHRDLKPANIKVRDDGTVKVLDFGLAKAMEPPVGSSPGVSMSPTLTTPALMTGAGMILGTAAYMAPEQARGKAADKRADIWAFGCVFFEMLTSRRAFDGEEVSDVLASILKTDPDWSALPADVPEQIRLLLKRCFEKDRKARIADVSVARFLLTETMPTPAPPAPAATPSAAVPRPLWRRAIPIAVTAVVAGAIVGAGVWFATRPLAPRVMRTTITASGPAALAVNGNSRDIAISPDGSRVVYVGNNGTQLFVRALDALEPAVIASGRILHTPIFSPDGQWVGFGDLNRFKKVAISGGPAIALATFDGISRGATWLPDDTIVFATNTRATGLQRVPAGGGPVTVVTKPDPARGEGDHYFPEVLPGGRAVLFTITAPTGGPDASSIAVFNLDTNTQTILVRGGSHAQFVASGAPHRGTREGGHLVYTAGGTLRAVPFDAGRLAVLGPAVPVVPRLVTTSAGGADFTVATDGTLVYVDSPGGSGNAAERTVVWVDRAGKEEPIAAPPRAYQQARVSPDGTRLALYSSDQEQDIWVWDLRRLTLTRLTFDPTSDVYPNWTPDGRRIVYTSQRGGAYNLWWQAADGTGTAERLTTSTSSQLPSGLSPDGTVAVFYESTPTMARDLMAVTLDGSKKITPLLQTKFDERDGVVSPDGRWLAYGADNTGRPEIYVRPFPNTAAGQWQISTGGGKAPLWAHDGKELFFFSEDGALMRVPVEATPTTWNAGVVTKLLEPRYDAGTPGGGRNYDVSPDGRRFVMLKSPGSDATATPRTVIVVQHFDEELNRLAPKK